MGDIAEMIVIGFTFFIAAAFCWVMALDLMFDTWGCWSSRAFGVIILICALVFTGVTIAFTHDIMVFYGWL